MSKVTSLRKSLRRVLGAAVVATLLAVGFVSPAHAGYNNTVTVTIHYNRATVNAASDLQGWYAYTFNTTSPGTDGSASDNPKWTQFASTDTYGGVATVTLNAGSSGNLSRIGVIITDRATWTNANKDSQSGSDRFISITSQSSTEVWMTDASTTISTSDPKTPASPVLKTFKFHYDGSSPAVQVAARTKAFNNTIWLNGTWLKFDGTTANTTAGTDKFGKWVQYTLPYYTGQMDALFMIVANTDYTSKDGGNAGSVAGNRWIATTGATNAASSDIWLLTGDSTSWSGNAAFASNPYGSSAPTITSVTNATVGSGSAGKAGDTLTIAGTNLVPSNAIPARTSQPTVTIGGVAATVSPAPTASAASISVIVPAGLSVGANDVILSNASGSVTSAGGFTLASAPTITSISSTTPVRGQSITVNGTNLSGATFTVGGVAATVATPNATAPVITVPTSAPVSAGSVVATTTGGSASTAVTVTKGTPTLVAPSATGINYGAALSTSSLSGGSASINGVTVAGTFAFATPTAVPTAGTASYSVTFTPTDSTGFNSASTTTSVVVGKTTPTVATTPAASAITYGQTLASSSLTGGVASVAGTFAFSTPSAAPATGTASYNVTFTPTDTANYNTTNFNVSVTTNKATPTVTATPSAAGITYGAALSTATLSGGSASVAGAFAFATPTAVPNAGTYSAVVRFTPTDTTNYNTVDFNINVSVAKVTPTVTATPTPTKSPIRFGNTLSQIGLTGGGASVAGSFAYATPAATPAQGTPSVAVVFTPTDSTNYNSVNFNISFTVSVALPAITSLSPSTAAQGDLVTITGTDFDGVTGVTIGGQSATITTNPNAAPNDTSLVVRVPADAATGANNVILATGAGASSAASLTVTAATPTISSLSATSGIRGDSITITGNFYNGVTAVKFGSVSATSFTVNSVTSISATVPTAAANGLQNVTVLAAGGTSSGSAFTVNRTVPSVTATPTAGGITYGQTLASSTLTGGSASVAGSFAFTTPSTAPNAGTANQSVTFTPSDNTVYDTVVFNVSVTVSKATPTISVTPTAAPITYGSALSTATLGGGTASTAGAFAYATPGATPGAGTANQSVTFTPTDTSNYNSVTDIQVSVTVNKATPTLVAPTASGLVTGQSLSSSTLSGGSASNAGASVAGSFAWTSSGTVPAIGTANYSATFTPTDTTNFNTNTTNVSVTTYGVPTISSVSPTSGLATATVTITGTYLSNATVTIGGASASVSANTATSITTTVPAGATIGSGNVVVTTAGGSVSSAFTVLAAPTITSLSASSAQRGGALTINGTNLGSATVTIGGTAATVSSNSATAIAVTVPTGLAFGSQSVVVTTAGGSATNSGFSVAGYSSATLTVHYNKQSFSNVNTYLHSWVQTGTGSASGISVTGSNSTQSPETSVDDLGYDSYGAVAKITYTGSNIQQVGFLVWTQSGAFVKDTGSSSDRYRTLASANDEIWIRNYDSTVSNSDPFGSINPNPNRPTTQSVTIHYDGNTATYPKVYLATRSDLNDTAVNPYSYWVAPAYLDFTAPVTITGARGSSTTTVGTDTFGKYVTYTFPYNANHTTWANMIVGNAGLTSKDGGQVGTGNRYVALDASGDTSIWLVSGDTSSNSGNAAYTSNPFATPVVSSLSATTGKAGDSITITGTGLKPQTGTSPTVTIDGISATVTSATSTSVVVAVPAGLTIGKASAVVLSNAGGTSNSDKTFTRLAAPTLASVNPTSGVRGSSVELTGTNFTAASTVTVGGISAAVTYNSATSLTVVVPNGVTNGALDVAVTTLGGTATNSGSLTVTKATPSVTATPSAAAITYGQTLVSATLSGGSGSVAGAFAFATPSAAPNAGTANQSVVFTPTSSSNYNTVTISVSVTVNKATPSVTATPSAAAITYGQTLASATLSGGSGSVDGAFAFATPSAAPNAGSADQTVIFTPTDTSNYNTASTSVSVTVNKGTPDVTWPTAAGIRNPALLGSSTLSGGSASFGGVSIAGTFAWATPSATPTPGTGDYTVTFTPDSANYSSVDSTVSLTVAKQIATAPTIEKPVQVGLSASAVITAASGTTLSSVLVTVDGVSRELTNSGDTYSVELTRSDFGKAVVFSAVASATGKEDSETVYSESLTIGVTSAPTSVSLSQSGLDVTADIQLVSGTSVGTVTATVGTTSPVAVTANGSGKYVVTLSTSDAGKSVVFSATAVASDKAESDATSSSALTFAVATAPTFGSVSQSGLVVSVQVNAGEGQNVGTVSATVDGAPASVSNTSDIYQVTVARSAIGKAVIFTATATADGKADSDSASTNAYTVLVTSAPTFGAITQNELTVSAKVNLGGDQTYGSVTASVDGGESQATTSQGDGIFSITVTLDQVGKGVVFSATASQAGKADSAPTVSSALTIATPKPQVTSLSVDYGIRGASIVATGNYLTGGTVKFGTVSAEVTSGNLTSITFKVPTAVTSGVVGVAVTTDAGTSSAIDFTVADAPSITGFAAWMGSAAPYVTNRGRTFDIFGTNLTNASFKVGGVPVSTVTPGNTVVRVMLPADAAMGTNQPVVATTAFGGSSNVMYIDVIEHAPVITGFGASAVRPGELFTIYGNWLDNPTKVRFSRGGIVSGTVGTDAALTGEDVSLTTSAITVRVPLDAQSGRIRIYTPVGYIQSTDILTVYPAPKITAMKLGSVSATGAARGRTITLAGSGLLNASVKIGNVSAQVAASPAPKDTGINVVVPNGVTPGDVTQLVVTSQYGVPSDPVPFTVGYDQPVVYSLSVSAAKVGGLLTINGKDLTGILSVKFNSNKLADLTDAAFTNTDTAVTVKVPAGAVTGIITVVARGGSVATPSFTVYQAPTITTITPAIAKAGTVVTVAGTNLTGTTFTIGGVTASPAASFTATSTAARIVVPEGAEVSSVVGDSSVAVTADGGSTSKPFTVITSPIITSLGSSSVVVGNDLTINGSYLANPSASPSPLAVTAKVGNVLATVKSGATDSQLVVTVPLTALVGNNTVSITTAAGTVSRNVTVLPLAPSITSLSATTQNRGLTVRITGTNLAGPTVTVGGVSATVSPGASATGVTVTIPTGTQLGSQSLVLTTAGGSDSKQITVVTAPTISSLGSSSVVVGNELTINGSDLANPSASPSPVAVTAKVGNVVAVVKTGATDSQIVITVPLTATVGNNTVSITTVGGTVTRNVTIVPLAPSITSLSVTTQNRGLTVRITGTNLAGPTVTVGGVSATVSAGASATAVTITIPATAPLDAQALVLTTAGGSDTTQITVKANLPTVTNVSQVGTKRGVGTVTVTGSYFTGATVKVGSVTVSNVNVNEAGTSLTFTIPATATVTAGAIIQIINSGGTWSSTTVAQKIAVS